MNPAPLVQSFLLISVEEERGRIGWSDLNAMALDGDMLDAFEYAFEAGELKVAQFITKHGVARMLVKVVFSTRCCLLLTI